MNPDSNLSENPKNEPCASDCGCRKPQWNRRDFLRAAGLGSLALMASRPRIMAGPFQVSDFDKLVPADKKLSPAWVRSLFERGEPAVLRKQELDLVGMPVGGICTGQLYLGGDGKLWHWDIFNQHMGTGDGHYAKPPVPRSPIEQGFSIAIKDRVFALDKSGFADIAFRGQYPIGTVEYKDPQFPGSVVLEAFSPFIPLNTEDSSLPATVMRFTVTNTSSAPFEASLVGSLENAVCCNHANFFSGLRKNRVADADGFTFLECSAESRPTQGAQPEILFEDWSKETYDGWTAEGTAFGKGPILKEKMLPSQATRVGGDTARVVNSYATAPNTDQATGKLTSRPFQIERKFILFQIGGGRNPGKTCLNLVIDGKVVRSATGKNDNQLVPASFNVSEFRGKEARLEIVDAEAGPWGNIGIGRIVFGDLDTSVGPFDQLPDNGTMVLALLGARAETRSEQAEAPLTGKLVGRLGRTLALKPGESATATFVITWHFPNQRSVPSIPVQGRYYAAKFDSAQAVAAYVARNFQRLSKETFLWRDTCYDSSLPYWFLDRTFLNTSILATSTCFRFKDGRFWAWEGVGCCAGTCTHVWHYAHSMARQFPDIERDMRERVDFGLAISPDGSMRFRGENNGGPAIDGQSGTILRVLREHQMSKDSQFLKRVWPAVKKATQWLIAQDGDGDGIITGAQHNTLDADWFGPVAWLSGMYLAGLHAAAAMADEMGDGAFAAQCREIAAKGREKLKSDLFEGEYFINKVDPNHLDSVNSGTGCEIDQVLGQSWAFQVGLPRVISENETRSALKSLWRYNFSPDVGPYRALNKPGRWYAMAGEAGLLMCSFPRTDWGYAQAKGQGKKEWSAMYFNECMNGFEHQVAGHMIWEGMVMEGLAIERAIHDRYHPSKRNPWNEIECGDHYARSMASYGVFIAACGYEYHGPKGHLGFAPRLTPEDFKAPFTAAEGWGTFSQKTDGSKRTKRTATIQLKWGQLKLETIALNAPGAGSVALGLSGKPLGASLRREGERVVVQLQEPLVMSAGQSLQIILS